MAQVFLVDTQFSELAKAAVERLRAEGGTPPILIDVDDPVFTGERSESGSAMEYEDLLQGGDPQHPWVWPDDEWDSITLNYTSGTTGRPKGVLYHHRGE